MKTSKSKGLGAIEVIVVLVCLGIIMALMHYKSSHSHTEALVARATLAHLKSMADLIERQKRELGAYPMSLQAMVNKTEYLRPAGNSKGYTSEQELKGRWNGSYLKNYHVYPYRPGFAHDRFFKIDLQDIHPEMNGNLHKAYGNDNILVYGVSYEDTPGNPRNFNTIGEKIIKKCNGIEQVVITLSPWQYFKNSYGNYLNPCGYYSTDAKITDVHYFITDL